MATAATSDRSYLTAVLLSIFFGSLGVDRFYVGHIWLGLLKLITGGGFGIWYLIDVILFATGTVTDIQGLPLSGIKNTKRTVIMCIIGLLIIGTLGVLVGLAAFRASSTTSESAAATEVQPAPEAEPTPGRVKRIVGDWTYTVDSKLENQLAIKVTPANDTPDGLQISGSGCNSISTTVTDKPSEGARSRTIGSKTYYLDPGVSTMMACTGDKANADGLVQQEIYQVFATLSRRS